MKLDFVKLSPTQNMTLLVTSPVPRALQSAAAEQLMAYDSVHAEQVGFLEPCTVPGARARLQMMGGEFCGNATMSLGAFLAFQDALPDGESTAYDLEISGAEDLVRCRITRSGRSYRGAVCMPLPTNMRRLSLPGGVECPVVFLPGIAHAIIPAEQISRETAEERIAEWCAAAGQDAFGVLLCKENAILPLVYVRSTNSAVWERGCGSGTAALAAWKAFESKADIAIEIAQPGGTIAARADYRDGVRRIEICGTVKIAAMGQAWVD